MKIHIANPLYPHSNTPGTFVLIPRSPFAVQIFPTLLRFYDLSSPEKKLIKEKKLDIVGPFPHFTVVQDLERGVVGFFGDGFSYQLFPDLTMIEKKNPPPLDMKLERLSLGSHKKQSWERVRRDRDFYQIFPVWHRLATLLEGDFQRGKGGMFTLLDACEKAIASHRPETILPAFEKLFLAAFSGLMVPRLFDEEYQGIVKDKSEGGSPLYLIKEGARLIRSLFVTHTNDEIALLPNLPPQFFAGRFTHISHFLGKEHFEWTKKKLRALVFECEKEGSLLFRLPPDISHFRLRTSRKDKGVKCVADHPIELKANATYWLDRFEK